jgi:extracellular elastinolytic metalloproteinase
MTPLRRRARTTASAVVLGALALGVLAAQPPATAGAAATSAPVGAAAPGGGFLGEPVGRLGDLSGVGPAVAPTLAQKSAAQALGADVSVTWNDAGTPASVFAQDGVLAPADGQAPTATAKSWISAHRDLLGLTAAQVGDLELVSDQPFANSPARAVLYRQRFGGLPSATRGMVTVGVAADGSVAYVSSSLVKAQDTAVPAATLTPLQGWLKAAADVGRTVTGADLTRITSRLSAGWTRLGVPGFDQPQLARIRAFARNDGTVRPVVEADVTDTSMGTATAYRSMVDAVTGDVLARHDSVENSSNVYPFQGTYGPGVACSQRQTFATTDALTKTIAVTAAAAVAVDDITLRLYGPGDVLLGSFDLATSPEVATYSASGNGTLPQGTYGFEVCGFDATAVGGPFVATAVTSDVSASTPSVQPAWRAFAANPDLASVTSTTGAPGNSVVECWYAGTPGCSPGEAHQNVAATGPWDQVGGVPTFTTIGNNANTHEAWASPLSPGGLFQAPYKADRQYTDTFTDAWNNSRCNPANLTPGGNDINAVVTNLFTGHNRIHDFAYYLGFTEENYNLQLDNGGRGGVGGDQEIGNAQAGAATTQVFDQTGVATGRNNANQIALQDGVPGITNQYLFQPVAGAFYAPCADGAMDTGIYGHEYTHAISNRMVGGPDDGLTSEQGGAMGESWSDLDAAEYQFENDYPTGTNPWALGAYTTGNLQRGIRDYAINENPLNYSDYGFDTTGPEVHADGEIWNGVQWEVRQALVDKWDAAGYKYADQALQEQCAEATKTQTPLPASQCPGNRRWLQLIYDAWLLQPGATDMLQARNAMLAADQMRFGGANQAALSSAFARRGMGADASTPTPDSDEPVPSFRSAYGNNSVVTFATSSPGRVYVGDFEARATPVADTDPATPLGAKATFTPGTYTITFVSPKNGFRRIRMVVPDSGVALTQPIDDAATNVASSANGAAVIDTATTTGSLNAASLIDGTEATNWAGKTATNVDQSHPAVAVRLAGGLQSISAAKVSALLRPAASGDTDPDSGSRFTALRQFALQACTEQCGDPSHYRTFYTSPADAFPGDIPRPVAPDQTLRTFRFPPVLASAVRLVALQNQCTGQPKYAGEQDADPTNATDCATGSDRGTIVHAAELQVFSGAIPDDPTGTFGTSAPGRAVKTHTRIRLPQVWQVRGGAPAKLKYQVVAATTSGGQKVGVAVIRVDGHKVKKVKIAVTAKHGKKVVGRTFRLPASLGLGSHRVQVQFKSKDTSLFSNSKSRRIVLTVVKRARLGGDG